MEQSDRDGQDVREQRPSPLSVADRVVAEYERLLEAMPVMAQHMGRLQGETDAMAEGERSKSEREWRGRGRDSARLAYSCGKQCQL